MINWHQRVEDDLVLIPDFIEYYENELLAARKEIVFKGRIEINASDLSTIIELRFNQLQDIEAVLESLNIECRRLRFKHYKAYLTTYNGARALTDKQLEKFAYGEPEILDMEVIINKVALVRNKFLGIMKGLESKSWCISNITRLRAAGIEDATI